MTDYRTPWDEALVPPASDHRQQEPRAAALSPKRRGRRPAVQQTSAPATAVAPAWHYHHLTVSGPAAALADFVTAARGTGVVPWRHDPAAIEEDVLDLVLAQPPETRNLSAAGCRILARQLRMAVEAHHARATQGRSCPLDLQALLPVPDVLLARGQGDPASLAWLREHWGVTSALRHPALRQAGLRPNAMATRSCPAGQGTVSYGFHTRGETPRAAVTRLGPRWLALGFDLQPQPAG